MQSPVETARSSNGDRDASQVRPGVSKLAISSVNVGRYRSLGAGTKVGIDYADAVVEQRRYGTTSGSSPDLDRVGRQCSHHSNLFGHVDAAGHALQGAWGANSPKCDLDLDGTINATDQSTQLGSIGVTSGFAELTRNRNRLGYAGYAADSESAERRHVRHRVLESKLGRWTKRDPLGRVDGISLYGYVQARPLRATDPLGLMQIDEYNADCLMHVMGMVPPAPPGCENEWFETIADCCFYNNHDPARSLRCAQTNLRSAMRKCIQELRPVPGTAPPPPPDHCYDECMSAGRAACEAAAWQCAIYAGFAIIGGCIGGRFASGPACLAGCVLGVVVTAPPALLACGAMLTACATSVYLACAWECAGQP